MLVAEDDPKQAQLLRIYLEREGHGVTLVADGTAALATARAIRPHLVVLDIMMPGLDGLAVCRALRMESDVPVLFLTARATESDLLRGLDIGADDYLTKPYSPRELVARVRALLRRSRAAAPSEPAVLTVGDLQIDLGRFEVRVDEQPIGLTAKEFNILRVLAQRPGRAFTRSEIIDRAFDEGSEVLHRTIDAHVMNLRRKLEPDPSHPRYVQTVQGRGYRLAEPSCPNPGRGHRP
ncbi:MAG: response regulator transcription factor [Micromonosporaceae bacterium]|nr:response regulator transcription factor [Micromonosporaceae bacterium]